MAKNISAVFKFKGTIEDVTFVDSPTYGQHTRARKNSKTPFVMTEALAESKGRLQLCNQYARPVFAAMRQEAYDGRLWSRMVSLLFAELKAGRPLNLECLKGFECNLQHKLSEVITGGYDFSATPSQNQLGVYVQLHAHPKVEDTLPRTGYQLRFVAIVPDAENGTVYKQEVLGPLTKYNDELTALDLPITLPGNGTPCLLLMGIVPHLQGEGPSRIMSDSGMRVVWVGGQDTITEIPVSDLKDNNALAPITAEIVREESAIAPTTTTVPAGSANKALKVEITDEEKEGFLIVKAILRKTIKPDRIVFRKGPSCLSVLLDDDPRKTICRLYLDGPKWYIGTFDGREKETTMELFTMDDLFKHAELLYAVVEGYDET